MHRTDSWQLSWCVRGLSEHSGLDIQLSISENFGRLPQDMELVIFRLIQECLTNVHRRSGGNTTLVRVVRSPEAGTVQVEDQGKGMTPERFAEHRRWN
jgi:two-component system, NarL family, sensor kinase